MNKRQAYGLGLFCLIFGLVSCTTTEEKIKPEQEAGAFYKFGVAYLNETPPNLQNAYLEFLKAIQKDPKNKEAHYALGHVHAQRRDYPRAIEAFQKTIALDPSFSEAHNYMGNIYQTMGNEADAIRAYQNALSNTQYATPQLPHWNLGVIYLKRKKYETALAEFLQVRQIEPNNVVVLNKIAETYEESGQSNKALLFFQEATLVAPSDHQTHFRLASFHLKRGEQSDASKAFKKVIELAPESFEAEQSREKLTALQ